MDRLVSVIGPAPSEMSYKDLVQKITKERERVSRSLRAFVAGTRTKKKTTRKASGKKEALELKKIAQETGVSIKDLLAMIGKEKGGKG